VVVIEQFTHGPVEVICLKNISDDHNTTIQLMTILSPAYSLATKPTQYPPEASGLIV
jgi:hypothetical protein